jgi:hypothetical protein
LYSGIDLYQPKKTFNPVIQRQNYWVAHRAMYPEIETIPQDSRCLKAEEAILPKEMIVESSEQTLAQIQSCFTVKRPLNVKESRKW